MEKKIRWAAIQPLTGGAYLGTEEAIGHPAEWIMSFSELSKTTQKDGSIISGGNEYYLLEYLKKKDREVPYYTIMHNMFEMDVDDVSPKIECDGIEQTPNYDELDLVIGVPVCSGLSVVTRCSDKTKDLRNSNMQWMAKYTLTTIKPKVYIFENAPTLMSDRGDNLRYCFEQLAEECGYSIMYYKTDTILHHNCQKRPRTFVIFIKHLHDGIHETPPEFDFSADTMTLDEFLRQIPENTTCTEPIPMKLHNRYVISFIEHKFGKDWRATIHGNLMKYITNESLLDELISYVEEDTTISDSEKEKPLQYFRHIKAKTSQGLNYYGDDIQYMVTHMPSVQFRSMPNMLHLYEDRIYNVREYLSFMGMPYDFDINCRDYEKIGQNVPVGTMKFMIEQILKHILYKWDSPRDTKQNCMFQDNIKHSISVNEYK